MMIPVPPASPLARSSREISFRVGPWKSRRGWRSREVCPSSRVVVVVVMMAAAGAEAPDSWYLALLGFAEHFRTSSPPKIRLCVHCLQAVFQFKPPQRVEARTHLQLGSVLYHHTKNSELARTHLEKAVRARRKARGFSRATRPQSRKFHYCYYFYYYYGCCCCC